MKRLILTILAGSGVALAQDKPAAPSQAAPASTPVDSQALDYLYNRNPSEGTAAGTASDDYRRGKSAADSKQSALESMVSSASLLSPDFEKFLSSQEADATSIAAYQALYDQAMGFLKNRKPVEAWQLLSPMSQFEWDAGLSNQIANRVRAVWDTDATAKELLTQNDKLQDSVRNANWNSDLNADAARRALESRTKSKDAAQTAGSAVADTSKAVPGTLRMTEEYFKSLDSKARIKLNEVKVDNIRTKAKTDLVDYITTLYKSRRYLHAVLTAQFYQALFKDGELPPEVANQATASLEAVREISRSVDVFRFKVQQKEITTASAILEKSWAIGDTTPQMLGLDRKAKLEVIAHANRIRRMRNLIEARDFENLELVLNEIDKTAVDFDTTKPRSLIQAIKLDSRMRLGKARLFAQQGNSAKAMEEFKAAAEAWPGNPDLNTASTEYFNSEDASSKNLTDFDREFATKNYRAIAEKQLNYLSFVQADEGRKGRFSQALNAVRAAETASEKAALMDQNGDSAGAWETVEIARLDWPEDSKLNIALAQYSAKSPQFVSAINRAKLAEEQKQLGASMSLYALARSQYPASQLAANGLKRTSQEFLNPKPIESPTPQASATASPVKNP